MTEARRPAGSVPIYVLGFVVLGMSLSFSGPALAHLRERSGVSIEVSGLLLGAQAIGYILASLASGRGYDRGHGHRLWAAAACTIAAAVVTITFVTWFPAMLGLFLVIGAAGAVTDVGGNTLVVWSAAPERVGSALNALHLCFGIGALSTPLLVSRSLLWSGDIRWFAGVLALAAVVLAVALLRAAEPTRREAPEVVHGTRRSRRGLLALVCLFFFLYVGLETGFAGWVHTYAEEIHLGDVGAAGALTSVFWSGFTGGRLLAIWLARRISPVALLVGSCILATTTVSTLAVADGRAAVVWIGTGLFGVSVGPQFPTMIAYGDHRLRLSGAATSLIIASSGLGGLVLPVGIGWLFDRHGATAMPWTVSIASVATTAVVVVIVVAGRRVSDRP